MEEPTPRVVASRKAGGEGGWDAVGVASALGAAGRDWLKLRRLVAAVKRAAVGRVGVYIAGVWGKEGR